MTTEPVFSPPMATEPGTFTTEEEVGCVRRHLRAVGKVPEVVPSLSYGALVAYLQERRR